MQLWTHNLKVAGSNPAPATNLTLMCNGLRKRNPFSFRKLAPFQAPNMLVWVHCGALWCTVAQNQIKAKFVGAWRAGNLSNPMDGGETVQAEA